MRKLILLALVVVMAFPLASSALTQEETNAQLLSTINSLMVMVQDLMKKLVAMQTQQVTDSATLGAIQSTVTVLDSKTSNFTVNNPVPAPVPVLTHSQILNNQVTDKFVEMSAVCSRTSWLDTFKQLEDWFNSVGSNEAAATGFYDVYGRIDGYITSAYTERITENRTPTTDYLCGEKVGCNKVLEIQKPYIACMLGQ
jgi:hypothetical protein